MARIGSLVGLAAVFLLVLIPFAPANARSVALIIGNDAYEHLPKLQKAVADAQSYTEVLESQGFDVALVTDAGRASMDTAIATFLDGIGPGDTAVFAYSGHGWSDGTQNFIVGTDAPAAGSQEFLTRVSIPLRNGSTGILDDMDRRGAILKVAIIDACRDNPFESNVPGRSVGIGRGLARMEPPNGSFVVFSAGTGQVALDRLSDGDPDPNSVFTRVFVPLIRAGLTLQEATKQTQTRVAELSRTIGHDQRPAYYDEVLGRACLSDGCADGAAPAGASAELVFWDSIRESADIADFEAYLARFPGGSFAALAQNRIAALQAPGAPATVFDDPLEPTECDRLASEPGNPDNLTGITATLYDDLAKNPGPAIAACQQQASAHPTVRRFASHLAFAYVAAANYAFGRQWAEKARAMGSIQSTADLAFIHLNGLGVPADPARGVALLREAAEAGLPDALANLGYLYNNGIGVERDPAEARVWYARAVAAGDRTSLFNLAELLAKGVGGPVDYRLAAQLYLRAMNRGHETAFEVFRSRAGDYAPEIRQLVQQELIAKGLMSGPADGAFGETSRAALDAYQASVSPR